MESYIVKLDYNFFLWLNSFHTPKLDLFMQAVSHSKTWIPFYLFLVYLIFKFKPKKNAFIFVLLTLISVGLSDYIASGIFKPYFGRFRPCYTDSLNGLMVLVGDCGGKYGFISSHASTSFALAFSILKIFGKKAKISIFLLLWAILISYSRIYLGVHFPLDVLCGGILGIFISIIIFRFHFYSNFFS